MHGAPNQTDDPVVPGDRAERIETARRRASTYRLLADVFNAEPTAEMLDSLRQPQAARAFQALGASFTSELDRLEADLGRDRLAEELQCEYTRLFLGPGKHVGPYESLHRDDHPPQHWGPSTVEVKRFIEHHGFGYREDFHGMPDHIAVQFQFMAEVAEAEAQALQQGRDADSAQAREIQRVFHQEHLDRWVPTFCVKVVELAHFRFYRDFARMAKALCEADRAMFTQEDAPGG